MNFWKRFFDKKFSFALILLKPESTYVWEDSKEIKRKFPEIGTSLLQNCLTNFVLVVLCPPSSLWPPTPTAVAPLLDLSCFFLFFLIFKPTCFFKSVWKEKSASFSEYFFLVKRGPVLESDIATAANQDVERGISLTEMLWWELWVDDSPQVQV